ncbi:type IV pilin protein [Billgrantia gudaonensis]|uniref:Type IV pilus assembly protein PilE n=1 Tax=Billgrantia gudaonensis TaxID=376427 RepID=A0A1G9C2Z3_9GAMM|nr:type IV pilin protein [Halomonas gudaonensis]SDK46037.1 type IV pilus assembly protein PilE [Halomonas gudaonensis]
MTSHHRFCHRQTSTARARRSTGFTLIELLITVAIIGILAAIAYPSYTGYVEKSRRAEAQSFLLNIAGALERCYTNDYSYSGCGPADDAESDANTESDYYSFTVSANGGAFTVTASPTGSQAGDACGDLSVDETGETSAGASGCW